MPQMLYKLQKAFYSRGALLLFFLIPSLLPVRSQDIGYNRPPVTSKLKIYRNQVKKDSSAMMVELKSLIPDITYDLRYATIHNFMQRMMYPAKTNYTFLRQPAACSLKKVQEELNSMGLGLKIFDAYRPYSVTVKFWELVKDERYVAHPAKGSGHNRGTAVDLTIINMITGKELNMGTGFDNFSDTARHNFAHLPEEILQNRLLLKDIMEKHGYRAYTDEWWHYSWPAAAKFDILDIDFRKLKKKTK